MTFHTFALRYMHCLKCDVSFGLHVIGVSVTYYMSHNRLLAQLPSLFSMTGQVVLYTVGCAY